MTPLLMAPLFTCSVPRYRHPAVVCAWCGLVVAWITTTSEEPAPISHTICKECDEKLLKTASFPLEGSK